MEPTIYKPSIYNGNGVYKNGTDSGGGGGITDEYTELEYIEVQNTNGAAIVGQLATPFENDLEINFLTEYTIGNGSQTLLIMKENPPVTNDICTYVAYSKVGSENRFIFRNYNTNSYVNQIPFTDNVTNKSKYTIKENQLIVETENGDKYTYMTSYYSKFTIKHFCIFSRGNTNSWPLIGKFFYLNVKDNGGNKILDLRPVKRKLDSVAGMFDIVSGNFYGATYNPANLIAGPIKL